MKKQWSKSWKSSKQPRKQRKYIYNAPLHIQRRFMSAHLSKILQKKYNKRNLPVKAGDTVKIMRGQFKNKTGKIERVNIKEKKVYITNIQTIKRDGTKTYYPIHPSNLMIQELNLDDKKRQKILSRKENDKKTPSKISSTKKLAIGKKKD